MFFGSQKSKLGLAVLWESRADPLRAGNRVPDSVSTERPRGNIVVLFRSFQLCDRLVLVGVTGLVPLGSQDHISIHASEDSPFAS